MTMRLATAAGAGPDTRFFVPFMKVEEQADGSVYVEGIATGEVLDFHGEVVSYEASKAAFERWSAWAEKATDGASLGNIRVMHQPVVGGKAVKWWSDDATRTIHLGARIEDPTAAKLCKSRAYTGYSIGGGNVTREMQPWEGKSVPWITYYDLSENSIVDKPACPTATFTLVKRALTQETAAMKPIEFLKANFSAALLFAAAMPDKDTLKLGDQTIAVVEKDGVVDLELRKDAASAVVAGGEALGALKKFMIEVLGIDGDPDMWTIGDICDAMRYCYSARMGAQYAVSDSVTAAANADLKKSETPADPPAAGDPPVETETDEKPKDEAPDPPAPTEAVPPAPESESIENVVKAQLAPLSAALEALATSIAPLVKAFTEGALAKGAGTEIKGELLEAKTDPAIEQLQKDVTAIKGAIEKLPAPPPGTPVRKTLGTIQEDATQAPLGDVGDAIALVEKALNLDENTRTQLRIKAAAASIRRT